MKLGEIYRKAVATGIENDPRGKARVSAVLKNAQKEFDKLSEKEKERFDRERLANPYADTRILCGGEDTEVATVIAGIDMEAGEIVAAQMLNMKGGKVDLVLSHHPEGSAYAMLYDVMNMQSDILNKFGVPINVMEGVMGERIKDVRQKLMPANHQRGVDIARLFGMPMMCIHTAADNCVATFLQKAMDGKKPETLGEIIDILEEIPEYKEAIRQNNGPNIIVGSKDKRCGKVFVDMTGGTEGSKNIFENLSGTGIGTFVAMHMGSDNRKEAEKNHINVVIAGHIASDNLGLNIMFDSIDTKNKLKIIPVSGYRRTRRK